MLSLPGASPLSPYGTLAGELFIYHQGKVAFESLPDCNIKKCILIGGLSDGLLPVPYTRHLQDACHDVGWSLVQPILSSSYTGFGHGSLDRDVEEMLRLMAYLTQHRNAQEFAVVGHSTGCQDAVALLEHLYKMQASSSVDTDNPDTIMPSIRVVALQAPVSDRETPMNENKQEYDENIKTAQQLVKDSGGDAMMPRSAFWAPITAQRFLDLQSVGGRDDYFSGDYTDEQLQERLDHVGKYAYMNDSDSSSNPMLQLLVAFSGSDEYVPEKYNDNDRQELTQRLVNAMNSGVPSDKSKVAHGLYIPNGNHNLSSSEEDIEMFVNKVKEMLQQAFSKVD